MIPRRLTAAAVALSLVAHAACSRRHAAPRGAPAPSSSAAATARDRNTPRPARREVHGPLHFLAIGGGATPESTEVSLEQDIDLVRRTLPGAGSVLFAGGSESQSVRELTPSPRGDVLLRALGELFQPRSGRQSKYRAPRFDADRATVAGVEESLSAALSSGSEPLLVYVAAHGDQGSAPRENSIALWGGRPFTVERLAELHERHSRPLRLVATSCYSGGFAELAFAHADEHAGPSETPRCGVFAGTWDRQTSGCDANPDRRAQESYGLHFIHALARADRAGRPLAPELVDFDHDGKVGLLDAHTRARIAAASLDVPTTTSERWLRKAEPGTAPIDQKILPEDAAVVAALGAALNLRDEAAVERRAKAIDRRIGDLSNALDDADDRLDETVAALTSSLLARWPVLDDAYHPDFAAMLARNRAAIREMLERSPEAEARAEAQRVVEGLDEQLSDVEVEEARVLRLSRAYETLHHAAALMKRGGPAARYYQALLACEREPP